MTLIRSKQYFFTKIIQWIPCEEGSPEDGEECLVLFKDGSMTVSTFIRMGIGQKWLEDGPITHWAFLPEPPDLEGWEKQKKIDPYSK